VDRWDRRENQMIAVLTQPDGNVTVTDGIDADHQIPSFPSLQKLVTSLVDELSGEVAGVRDIATHVNALANAAADSATASAASADQSAASALLSDSSAGASEQSAAASAVSATASEESRQASTDRAAASAASAQQSADSAAQSAASATLAGDEADDSAASASTALLAMGDAQAARTLAQAWAANPEDVSVVDGEFSAKHWAKKAQSFATGSLVYLGAWDASTGTLPPGAKKGAFYKIVGTGIVDGVTYRNGDNIVHNGNGWDLIDNTETVTAVAGKVGNVSLETADVGGLQAALDGKANANHSHAIADVVNLQTTLDSKFAKTGGTVTGEITAPAFRGGGIVGPAFYVGNDAVLMDIDRANCVGIQGQSTPTVGEIKLGSTGPILQGNPSGLVVYSALTAVQGSLSATGEIYSTSANSFRQAVGAYGSFWRQDGSTLYLMFTNANDAYGSWNSLRPFTVNVTNGTVSFGHTVTCGGRLTVNSDLQLASRYIRGNGAQIEFVNSPYSAVINIFQDNGVILGADFQIWSDRRLKTEIKPLEFDAIEKLKQMPPRHYLKHNISMEPIGYEYGFIHDEVEAVLPDATQRTDGTEDIPNVGSVATPQLVAVLAKAVLQLNDRLEKAGIA
jgi:hypothetical protein